jgi:hypothetical protein
LWLGVKLILPIVLYVLRNTRVFITSFNLIHCFNFPTSGNRQSDCLHLIHASLWRHHNKFFSTMLVSFKSWHLPILSRNNPILWNQIVHYHMHGDTSLEFISRQVNLVPSHPRYLQFNFIWIFQLCLGLPRGLLVKMCSFTLYHAW